MMSGEKMVNTQEYALAVEGNLVCNGTALAQAIKLDVPLSFWGGYDSESGTIIDASHPNRGQSMAGKILVMQRGRGSSSSSSVLAEAIRAGTGPVGIVLAENDPIIVLGALVAGELYGIHCPIIVTPAEQFDRITDGDMLSIAGTQ